jgi:hypothetical protein
MSSGRMLLVTHRYSTLRRTLFVDWMDVLAGDIAAAPTPHEPNRNRECARLDSTSRVAPPFVVNEAIRFALVLGEIRSA